MPTVFGLTGVVAKSKPLDKAKVSILFGNETSEMRLYGEAIHVSGE